MRGETVTLGGLATVAITDGPPMIKSENARPNGWIYVDIRDRDLGGFVADAKQAVAERVQLPPGYSIAWSGQFEYMERAAQRLRVVVPFTLVIIFLLLYLTFRSARSATLIMATLPFALVGGFRLIHLLGHHLSVASGIGFIALAGVAAEFGVVMLIYLDNAIREREGFVLRVREPDLPRPFRTPFVPRTGSTYAGRSMSRSWRPSTPASCTMAARPCSFS